MTCMCPRPESPRTVQDPYSSVQNHQRPHGATPQHSAGIFAPPPTASTVSAAGQALRARRPALVPSNSFLSSAEAADLVRTRVGQPFPPPPDPSLIRRFAAAGRANGSSDHVQDTERQLQQGVDACCACSGSPEDVEPNGYVESGHVSELVLLSKPSQPCAKRKHADFLVGEELLYKTGALRMSQAGDGEPYELDCEDAIRHRSRVRGASGSSVHGPCISD